MANNENKLPLGNLQQPEQPQYPILNVGFAPDLSIVLTIALGPTTSISQAIAAEVLDEIEKRRREARKSVGQQIDFIQHLNATRNNN